MSVLVIPIDASQVPDADRGQQKVKVAAKIGDKVVSQVVAVTDGKAEVKLDVDPKQPLTIALGPDNVTDEEIFNLQTLTSNVSPNLWAGKATLKLPPIIVNPFWWLLWLRWCRTFVIQGRVVCANGRPVPGAEVRAYDVDFFWWWLSVSQVGPVAVTDANGHFAMKFRWCCGWWPWWWWRLRTWSLEPLLIEKIRPVLKLNPSLKFREPTPLPTADIVNITGISPTQPPLISSGAIKDPTVLSSLRDKLVPVLPKVPELERLRIWPWWPWTPWLDCSPDIIFKVTQECAGQNRVIVNENIFQTRWDIPTSLNVTLVANDKACCVENPPPDPLGECAAITEVCGYTVNHIGGNPGAPPIPLGYADPGATDRPFAEWIHLRGILGNSPQTEFYEIEFSPHGAGAWNPLPGSTLGDFGRVYFDGNHTGGQWIHGAPFPVIPFGGKFFYKSRHFYETTNPPPDWGMVRVWLGDNYDMLAPVSTQNHFVDGNYDFRVVGYKSAGGNPDLATRKVLDGCGVLPNQNNLVVVRLDNRIASGPPPGTVHLTTTEPDCGITAVRLGAQGVAACGKEELKQTVPPTPLEIDFFVTDNPIGADVNSHLDEYTLWVKYDINSATDLLHLAPGTFTLSCLSGGQAGETYAKALTQPGGGRPSWSGGSMRLHINDARVVFPKTCCYLLELVAYKRNVVSCYGARYYNQAHYSFTVIVV